MVGERMNTLILAQPGTEAGPCAEPCEHYDCAQIRTTVKSICHYCGEEIGYDNAYLIEDKLRPVHSACVDNEIEERRRLA